MKRFIFVINCLLIPFINENAFADTWTSITLPSQHVIPSKNSTIGGNIGINVYCTQLPTGPVVWEMESDCQTAQPTSYHWRSDEQQNIKGISFKGVIFKQPELKGQGSSLNSFSVFFHQEKCYKSGMEYGWVFYESQLPKAIFYICANCNIKGSQKWGQWPPTQGSPSALKVIGGDANAVQEALNNSAVYRYWNISLTEEGNFQLELIDPTSYESVYVILEKPDWYSNLNNQPGYMTITAKKEAETTIVPAPYILVDEVKILK
jgi:hypothetical protein